MKVEWRIKSNNLPRSRLGPLPGRPFRFFTTERLQGVHCRIPHENGIILLILTRTQSRELHPPHSSRKHHVSWEVKPWQQLTAACFGQWKCSGVGETHGRSHMGEFMGGMHELFLVIPRDTFLVREFLRGMLRGREQGTL